MKVRTIKAIQGIDKQKKIQLTEEYRLQGCDAV